MLSFLARTNEQDTTKNKKAADPTTTEDEIIAIAKKSGYSERRLGTSDSGQAFYYFVEKQPALDMPPIRINVGCATRSIMIQAHQKTKDDTRIWRYYSYEDEDFSLQILQNFFENPRRVATGTSVGMERTSSRTSQNTDPYRGCVQCGEFRSRKEFSYNQWAKKGPNWNKCKTCVLANDKARKQLPNLVAPTCSSKNATCPVNIAANEQSRASNSIHDNKFEILQQPNVVSVAKLTADALRAHDIQHANDQEQDISFNIRRQERLVRRQFNCPHCPRYGRGTYIFFKKVPQWKPVIKCPQCKLATRGKCPRLYPLALEKGYGLFKCPNCHDKWGSSRAVANIGQECFNCKLNGEQIFVKPFRIEALKATQKNKTRGGRFIQKRNKRVPKEPIQEERPDQRSYTQLDGIRNRSLGNFALVRGNPQTSLITQDNIDDELGREFEVVTDGSRDDDDLSGLTPLVEDSASISLVSAPTPTHFCEGCVSGICKTIVPRNLPKSEIHDHSDGNTVSTRASIVTNSSINKAEYVDRDMEFMLRAGCFIGNNPGVSANADGEDNDGDGGSVDIITSEESSSSWQRVS